MSDTNFYDSLSAFAASQPLRMCMPGHKGRTMPMEEWDALAPLDPRGTSTAATTGWRTPSGCGPGTGA